jgi:hypothetical protein
VKACRCDGVLRVVDGHPDPDGVAGEVVVERRHGENVRAG